MAEINLELDGELVKLELYAERARTVFQNVTDDYFRRYDPEKDGFSIAYDFDRNGIYCDIVDDYLFEIEKTLRSIREMARGAIDTAAADNPCGDVKGA